MIRLHRLEVHNFRQLADVNLRFPDTGTVLIEGPNEAGKSTLFEAVYFALYGEGLFGKLEDLKGYGAEEMRVELGFSVDARYFTVSRKLRANQIAALHYCAVDDKLQTITGRRAVDQQIREELRLSATALLNTCFVEQKGLERLEALDATERKAAINELLNLRVLTELEGEFKPRREDSDNLQRRRQRVRVAQLDAEMPLLEANEWRARRCLCYAQILRAVTRWNDLQRQITTARQEQARIAERQAAVAQALAQGQALHQRIGAIEADLTLRTRAWAESLAAQAKAAEQVAALEKLAQTLPERERRLEKIRTLRGRLQQLEELEARVEDLQRALGAKEEEIAGRDALQREWEAGEEESRRLEAALQARRVALAETQEKVRARQAANQRVSRLALLLQQLRALEQATRGAEELSSRLASLRESAARLPALRDRLVALRTAAQQAQQRADDLRTLKHVEDELGAVQRRQAEAGTLAAQLAQNEERRVEAEQQQAAGRTAYRQASRSFSLGLLTSGGGVVLVAAGFAATLLPVLGIIGLIVLTVGTIAAARAYRARGEAQAAIQRAKSVCDRLDGERRAIEAQRQAIAGRDMTALEADIQRLSQERDRLREQLRQTEPLPARLQTLGVGEDPDRLQRALQQVQAEIATCEADEKAIPTLQRQRADSEEQAAKARAEALALAEELELPSAEPRTWAESAEAEREAFRAEKASVPDSVLQEAAQQALEAFQMADRAYTALQTEQKQRRATLEETPREGLETEKTAIERDLQAVQEARTAYAEVRPALTEERMPTESVALQMRLTALQTELARDQKEVNHLPAARQEQEESARAVTMKERELMRAWKEVLPGEPPPATPQEAFARLSEARAAAEAQLLSLDEVGLRAEQEQLSDRLGALEGQIKVWGHQQAEAEEERKRGLALLGVPEDAPVDDLPARSPELAGVQAEDAEGWQQALEEAKQAVGKNRSDRRALAALAEIGEDLLDLEAERAEYEAAEKALAVKKRAHEIVLRTRQSIISKVMPLTEQNMRRILPLLTEGRYADVKWEETTNTLSVYDSQARAFVRKRVFSGGARDQISLALRLSFALATLPGERSVRPAWLFLDEPLSSFDRQRTRALVDLLTRGLIRQQFDQIFLISHSESFDPSLFDYRLRMEGGRIAESTLPPV